MITTLVMAGLAVDWLLGEPRRWHPLVGFGIYARCIERWLHPATTIGAEADRWRGLLACTVTVAPPVALVTWLLRGLPHAGAALQIGLLYLTVGLRSLHEHALPIAKALNRDDLPLARQQVARIVSRDTADMSTVDVARAAVESVLENGNDALFATLFWFLLAGAPGALLYRLVNTLDAMWGYRTPRYRFFGWAAARTDDLLNLVPARLTALTYALLGNSGRALRCWWTQGRYWESPNAGPVMAAGAGSLKLSLGGSAFYHGHWKWRAQLGRGAEPQAADILRALRLVRHGALLWIAVGLACSLGSMAAPRL